MAAVIFECPRTRRLINPGVDTDERSLWAVGSEKLRVDCPHCRKIHQLPMRSGRLTEDAWPEVLSARDQPKPTDLTIVINALRISFLKNGLAQGRN